ncbi:MAG: hypothetical protein A2816_00070 [Candidatus Yanofskybacteria bacterium RIFCSPHIGHO2_01_FULL_39_44]|nr:MAG: hypothetical protein A2816_00070 [Candidatus Yanofskybacteria bacterium RIFCSPHIGHO2_01_FULL_39_44]
MNTTISGIFIASFFLGENVTIPAFVLANQGYLDLKIVIIAAYCASLSADLFWYCICRLFFKKFDLDKWYNKANISNQRIYKFVLDKHIFFSITFIKFLIGLRLILTLALIMIKKFTFKKFFIFSVLSNIVLIFGLSILGLLVSRGIDLLPIYRGISGIFTIIILSLILVNVIPFIVKLYFSKRKQP